MEDYWDFLKDSLCDDIVTHIIQPMVFHTEASEKMANAFADIRSFEHRNTRVTPMEWVKTVNQHGRYPELWPFEHE
ncbi:MAG: hypothetical protein P4L81_07960 [Candidatus Pacebacteria bacterium]|nr:hypothetical protein [Candidatus Paceibacterota bacterium]